MSDVNAQIKIAVDAAQAQAELKALQAQITALNASMASQRKAKGFDLGMGNAAGQITQIQTAASALNKDLQRMSRGFGSSFGTLKNSIKGVGPEMELARKNAAALGTQYTVLGRQANGAMAAFKGGQLAGFNSELAVMQQRVAIGIQGLNQMGTAALNWGKNIQWAGRQLMVGLTIPFTIFAGVAIKAFKDVETEIINLKKVYGDFGTSDEEVERVTAAVKELSREMSVLGFSAKETLAVAADAAAIGFVGNDLLEFTKQASEFASLGMMTQTEALNSLVAVNSAFKTEVADLKNEVNFLNAVENQTILSMQDMAEAIPITAAAIQGLGGDIKDLAVFMTAMREGGINANESANALKTSLARLITPTRQALETANEFGIALESIVSNNEGDLMGMVQSLAGAMESLSDLQQQQLLSDLFGKRQFARMGALFNNLNREGSQAQKTIELTTMSMEDLAQVRDKELAALKESPAMQLSKQLENIQLALAPIGEIFTELLVDILGPLETVLNWFNSLEDGFKKFVAVGGAVVAVLIPAITMFVGLMGNLAGTMMNVIATLARWATGTSSFTTEQAEMAAQANATAVAENGLTNSLQQQAIALEALIAQYNRLNTARMPGGGAAPPLRMATGGRVPGAGNTDKIPALLTPGEFVVNKQQSQKNAGFLHALNNGSVKGFSEGGDTIARSTYANLYKNKGTDFTHTDSSRGPTFLTSNDDEAKRLQELIDLRKQEIQGLKDAADAERDKAKALATTTEESERAEEAHRRRISALEAEEAAMEDMKVDFAQLERTRDEYGGVGAMDIHNNAGAHLSTDVNKAMSSAQGGVSGAALAQDFRDRPGAYDYMASRSIYMDALEDDKQAVEDRTVASERLSERMAEVADSLPEDTVVVDEVGNNKASADKHQISIKELQDQAQQELIDELQEELREMEAAGNVDESILDAKRRELAAQQRLADQIEDEEQRWAQNRTGMGESYRGHTPDDGDPTDPNSRAGRRARARRGGGRSVDGLDLLEDFPQKNADNPKTRIRYDKNLGSPSSAATRAGDTYDKTSGVEFVDMEAVRARLKAEAFQAGEDIDEGMAQGIRSGNQSEQAITEKGEETIDNLKTATGSRSASWKADEIGRDIDDGLAQGIRSNAQEPVKAVAQVGEQMELQFDESFDGQAAGRDAMQETEQGMRTGGTGTGTGKKNDSGSLPGQKRNRMQGSQMAQMGIGMGISALSTIPMMTGQDNIMGVSSEFTMGVGMATGQVAAFASMLPVGGAAVAGLAAAAGLAAFGLEALKKQTEKTAEEAYELGKNLGGAADAAQKMSDVFGKATAIQKQNTLKFSDDEQETADEFAAAIGSEGGKALIEELSGEFGDARVEKTAQYIESAIVNGMIEADQANTFAKALANELGDIDLPSQVSAALNKTRQSDYTRTQGALSLAEKRDKAVQEDGTVGTKGIKGAAATMGASMQALQDWSTVAAVAKDEYANGIISYKEYIDVLNQATDAQANYADMLKNSPDLSDSSFANRTVLENLFRDSGLTDEETKSAFDRLQSGRVEILDEKGYVETGGIDKARRQAQESVNNRVDGLGDAIFGSYDFGEALGVSDATQYDELLDVTNKDAALFQALYNTLGDYNSAMEITLKMQKENSAASQIYNDVLKKTNNEMAALQATIAVLANEGSNLVGPNYQDAFIKGFENKEVNPEMYSKLFSEGQTVEQREKQLGYASGSFSYTTGGYGGIPASEQRVAGGNLSGKQKAQYADAMGSIAEIVGPDMQDKLTEYVAAGIRGGSEHGGTEGIAQLQEIFGDQEVVNAYIELDLEDGKLDETKEIAEQLKYIKEEIPPDMQVLFGINLENPEEFKKLSDPTTVDTLRQVGLAIEELPEGEKELAAEFAMSQVNNGKPMSLKSFRKDFKEIKKLTDDMEDASISEKREMLIDVITKVNGGEVDPAAVGAVYDDLISQYGEGIVSNLPPTTLTKVINMKFDASQMQEQARTAMVVAMMIGDKAGIDEAKKLMDAANELDSGADDIVAGGGLNNTSGSSGGGGGGGEESNWYKDLFKTEKEKKDALKRRNELITENKKIAKEGNKLNQEVIDALAADEKAFDDYEADVKKRGRAKANKRVNRAYFGNIKKDEDLQTEEMRTQKRREDKVKSQGYDYFTEQQILNDPELLELFDKKPKQAARIARERAEIETTTLDRLERQAEVLAQQRDLYEQGIALEVKRAEYLAENAVLDQYNTDRATLDQRNSEIDAQIRYNEYLYVKPIQRQIDAKKEYIKELEREYEINQDRIDDLKDEVETEQRRVETLQRALELRQREGEMLSHDLKLMDWAAEDINKAYEERVEALDQIAQINERIAQSQQDQLSLADALSRGDIGAAAAAAQQMQQNEMAANAEQARYQLERAKDNAIDTLTGAESGMTREEIEERQRELEEDSYYTNLAIRDIEDEIYDLNRKIRDEQDIINGYKDTIADTNKEIKDLEWDIYEAQKAHIKPLELERDLNNTMLAQADLAVTKTAGATKIALENFKRERAMWEAEEQFLIARVAYEQEHGKQLKNNFKMLRKSVEAANEYYKALQSGNGKKIAMPKLDSVDLTFGDWSGAANAVDSAALQKAFDEYAIGGITTASFNVPTSAVSSGATSGIMSSVTNNNYNSTNNVTINEAGAPFDIDKTVRAMKFASESQVG